MVAHLIGFELPVILDIEMIKPGESEIVAARRLFERLVRDYNRFFDAIVGDALYWEGPLAQLCRKHNKHLLAVLKNNNPALLSQARKRLQGCPDHQTTDGKRAVQLWDNEHFASGAIDEPFRVVHALEQWTRRQRVGGKWVTKQESAEWFWATTIPRKFLPARQVAQAGHQRWHIENRVFNALSTHWGLDHCFRHDPVAILNFVLILFIAFTMLQCFYQLNMKPARRQRLTLIAVAAELLQGIIAATARQIAWRPLFTGAGP